MNTKLVGGLHFPEPEHHFAQYGDAVADYQREQRDYALTFVKDFRVAVDLGANVGIFSRHFAEHFDKVLAFEPTAINFECLRRNVPDNVECRQEAIGLDRGEFQLVRVDRNCGGNFIGEPTRGYEGCAVETVRVRRLDDFELPHLGLIKLDIQGFEEDALNGALKTLRRTRPVVLIEEKSFDGTKDSILACRRILRNTLGMVGKRKIGADRVYVFED